MWLSIESLSVRSLNFNILAIDDWKIYTERKTSKAKRSSVYASSKNNFWHITTLNSLIMHMRTCDFSVDLTLFFKWLFWSLSQIPTFWFKIFKYRRTTAGDLFCLAYKLTNHIHSFGWFKSSGCHWSKIPNVQDVICCHSASSSDRGRRPFFSVLVFVEVPVQQATRKARNKQIMMKSMHVFLLLSENSLKSV